MTDQEKTVEIKPDEGFQSIGMSRYFKDTNLDTRYLKLLTFVVISAIVSIYLIVIFSKRKVVGIASTPVNSPEMRFEVPMASPALIASQKSEGSTRSRVTYIPPKDRINVTNLRSSLSLPVGTEGKAILVSGGTDGLVKARILKPVLMDNEPVIPENSVLIGTGKSGEDRLFIEFQKIILPTGETYKVRAQAFENDDKVQGIKGSIVGTRSKKMMMAMGLGFLGGMADGMRENTSGSYFSTQKPTTRDAALSGASKAALDQSEAYLEEMKKSPNIIQVKSGTEFYFIIDEEKEKENYEK